MQFSTCPICRRITLVGPHRNVSECLGALQQHIEQTYAAIAEWEDGAGERIAAELLEKFRASLLLTDEEHD